ncbi:MAG: aminopeptidase P family protein [Deltaproteobacteria bacterium]|nr:MAG: aminopeptidase P family protein [Deltaproteobacteria bacterium]
MGYEDRIKILQDKIHEHQLCAALLFYSRDVLYYTGTAQPSYLVILRQEYFLFVKSGYDFALNDASIPKDRIREERRLENIHREVFSKPQSSNRIGTELDILTADQFKKFKKIFPGYEFVNVSPVVLEQRKRKDASEIDKIKEACEAIDRGHSAVLTTLTEGTTELELAAAVENAHRLAGHEGIFFIRQPDFFMSRGPVSSGPNLFKISGVVYTITGVGLSPSVPAGPSRRSISRGDLVIVDIPTLVNGYHADQTRSYVLGKANIQIETMYNHLKEIADYLIENVKPGMKCSDIYQMAVDKAQELEVTDPFLSFGRGRRSRMIGHGIGLELNEPPILSKYDHSGVSDGFVIALDMHMMDESVGVVKLEDVILITNSGNEILTKSPRHLFEV